MKTNGTFIEHVEFANNADRCTNTMTSADRYTTVDSYFQIAALIMAFSSKEPHATIASSDGKSKVRHLLARPNSSADALTQVVVCKRLAKMPMLFLAVRHEHDASDTLFVSLSETSTNA
jgi:hypothetical protein